MATNAFKSIHNNTSLRRRHHHLNHSPPLLSGAGAVSKSRIYYPLKTTTISISHPTTVTEAAPPSTTAVAATSADTTFELLSQHLSAKNYQAADEETRRLLIVLAGEQAEKRGYVFFSETQFISIENLETIDSLWRKHSDGKFGYSVQKKIWKKCNKDFTKLFIKIGWMKRLESSEVEQYNYRAFPNEFIWELNDETPEGHLPLTNALRGTQLLTSILTHPAFDEQEGEEEQEIDEIKESKLLSKKGFKTSYSF